MKRTLSKILLVPLLFIFWQGCASFNEGYYGTTTSTSNINFDLRAPTYFEGNPKFQPHDQNNPNIDFYDFIKGVKHVVIGFNEETQQGIDNGDEFPLKLGNLYRNYLHNLGFNYVAVTSVEKQELHGRGESLCDIAYFNFYYNFNNNYIKDIYFDITSCNGDAFRFVSSRTYRDSPNWDKQFYSVLTSMFWHNISKNDYYRLQLPKRMTEWNEYNLKLHFDNNGALALEGIYEQMYIEKNVRSEKYKLGVITNDNGYDIVYISGATNYLDWPEGDLKGEIVKTAKPNLYKVKWYMASKSENNDVYAFIDEYDFFTVRFGSVISEDSDIKYLKLYPTTTSSIERAFSDKFISSGTGFAISRSGLIVTNHHVIEDAKEIKIEVSQIGLKKIFDAEIVLSDQRNDLAILQINDATFSSFGDIPFTFKQKVSDMGTKVYTLGYPLIDTMGESIKLTDGLISSKMGFQGDISSYQLSVPIHPGNSGGPLFDYEGNLIGVVNAKHLGAENATYAIKSNYLVNLMELLPVPPELPTKNSLRNSTLSEQVKTIENFVFLIKVK
jgi:S1-C subfamily serine protease|tara:strand:- start:355 stop:2019 length:1665 start_codon:yes stop_codon:yes gene_type:complete